jgi:hypothetical protein
MLTLRKNQFTGPIPDDLALTFLLYLDISYNGFSGSLPPDWGLANGGMNSLRHFHVDHNLFTGAIPDSYPKMGKGRVEQFTANDNSFTGVMPGNWTHNDFISSMEIQNNGFTSLGVGERDNSGARVGFGVCDLIVFRGGEMINFDTDCAICNCPAPSDTNLPNLCGSGPPFCL